jgi:hypothetical protein
MKKLNASEAKLLETKYRPQNFFSTEKIPEEYPMFALRNISVSTWSAKSDLMSHYSEYMRGKRNARIKFKEKRSSKTMPLDVRNMYQGNNCRCCRCYDVADVKEKMLDLKQLVKDGAWAQTCVHDPFQDDYLYDEEESEGQGAEQGQEQEEQGEGDYYEEEEEYYEDGSGEYYEADEGQEEKEDKKADNSTSTSTPISVSQPSEEKKTPVAVSVAENKPANNEAPVSDSKAQQAEPAVTDQAKAAEPDAEPAQLSQESGSSWEDAAKSDTASEDESWVAV